MDSSDQMAWWLSFAHTRGMGGVRKMDLLIQFVYQLKMPLSEALRTVADPDTDPFRLTEKEREAVGRMILSIPDYEVIVAHMTEKGITLIPVIDPRYPAILKKLLKKAAPVVLYVRGDVARLQHVTTGVEGVRDASPLSLRFTETVVRGAVTRGDVIVGGFINPVEKKALDMALSLGGRVIVVLAEGINRFAEGSYERFIESGQLSLVSVFHPEEERSLRTTMDRNVLFYDFCNHVFVAQSSAIGGSWDGAVNRLAKHPLYVRVESRGEENFNNLLIANGGIAVDENGFPGEFDELQPRLMALTDNPDLPFHPDTPRTTAEYVGFLRKRLEKMQTISLTDFFREYPLPDRMRWQLENIFQLSPDIEKIRVGNKAVFTYKGAVPKQGKLF